MTQKILSNIFKTIMCMLGATNIVLAAENSLYIGGAIGAANLMNKESHAIQPESHQLGSIGVIGGGFVGYDFGISNMIRFALEFFADGTDLNTDLQHSSKTYQMKQSYNLGFRVLPEYIITPFTAIHLIFGYANG